MLFSSDKMVDCLFLCRMLFQIQGSYIIFDLFPIRVVAVRIGKSFNEVS